MLLVSQEKDGIINLNNVLVIRLSTDFETNKKTIIYVDCIGDEHFGIGKYDIGKYDTEERAKEVLQEIVKEYSSYLELKGGAALVQGDMDIQPNIFNIPKVYKMPEK